MAAPSVIQVSGQEAYDRAFAELIRRTPRSVKVELRAETQKVLRNVLRFTPPQKGKKQGESAVRRDVSRAVFPLRSKDFTTSPGLQALVREQNYTALNEVVRHFSPDHPAYNSSVVPFTGQLHQSQRDKRGRVGRRRNAKYSTPDESGWNDYLARKLGNVGQAKGGWARAYGALGGRVDKWWGRHETAGEYAESPPSEFDSWIRARNRSAWASGGDQDRIVADATQSRTEQIRRRLGYIIDAEIRQAGLAA